jgi:NAD(P)-dependent dehydrogenase (short-subunit alcohol dehydrogenase family)
VINFTSPCLSATRTGARYAPAKAAIASLTIIVAGELDRYGVMVSAIGR